LWGVCAKRRTNKPASDTDALQFRFIDFPSAGLILNENEVRGSRLAEMIGAKRRSNPLNLMRVMPPKEARLGHAFFRAWLFSCQTELTK
jgi:hypothetical protein